MFKYALIFLKTIVIVVLFVLFVKNDSNLESVRIIKSKSLTVIDVSDEYNIESQFLKTYINSKDPSVSYVNVTEFITFLSGGIETLTITKTDTLKLSYIYQVPVEYQDYYNGQTYYYEMIMDAQNDTLSFNDFDMIRDLNVPMNTVYETDLQTTDLDLFSRNPRVDIDLTSYDMDIVEYEGNYYIPLYLANLFLTGQYINVYEMNDEIYITDLFTGFREVMANYKENVDLKASDIVLHTENYLALYFDYFYGLKDYRNIDTYQTVLDTYQFDEVEDFKTLHEKLDDFIRDLNDLHSSFSSPGYMNKDYKKSTENNLRRAEYVSSRYRNQCSSRTQEVSYDVFDDTIVVHVNRFSFDTKLLLKPVMEIAKDYDHIMIDVGCNPGGVLIAVVELLNYMTDDRIPVSSINPLTGTKIIEYYEPQNDVYLDKDFYVFTTAASFSGANLFASIVKDMDLAVLVGEKSGGGACAISYTVLPDGAIIITSSNYTLINKNGEIIEDGIEVDVEYDYPVNWANLMDELISDE